MSLVSNYMANDETDVFLNCLASPSIASSNSDDERVSLDIKDWSIDALDSESLDKDVLARFYNRFLPTIEIL